MKTRKRAVIIQEWNRRDQQMKLEKVRGLIVRRWLEELAVCLALF